MKRRYISRYVSKIISKIKYWVRDGPDALEAVPVLPRIYYALIAADEQLLPDENIQVDCGEFMMWINPSSSGFGKDIYHHKHQTKEQDFESVFRLLCFDGMRFIDVGSHWGYYVVLANAICDPAQLIAFEPEPANVELLQRNIESNNVDAELVRAAVGDTTSDAIAWDPNDDLESGSITMGNDTDQNLDIERTVESVTLSDYFDRNDIKQVDMMKIDVEGAEGRVFAGIKGEWDRIDGIALELHTNTVPDFGDDPKQIIRTLLDEGYEVIHLDNAGKAERVDRARLDGINIFSEFGMTPQTIHILIAIRPETDIAQQLPDELTSLIEDHPYDEI